MITYNVLIPDNKQQFFQEFLELIGADYQQNNQEFFISDEQKKILDERLKEDKTNFISARESLNQLRKEYGL
jgi:ABC-type transporter MlaC component